VRLRFGPKRLQHDSDQVKHSDHTVDFRDARQQLKAAVKDSTGLCFYNCHVGLTVLHQPILLLLACLQRNASSKLAIMMQKSIRCGLQLWCWWAQLVLRWQLWTAVL
jgi:hypothetical protein